MKKIIQLFDCDGYPAGLYTTDRTDTENFQGVFDRVIDDAKQKQEENDDEEGVQVYLDELLVAEDFERVFAESVSTNEF
jgi:hypothetical protein